MSKRVNIYKPKISVSIVDGKRVTKIIDRKDVFLEERAVMDRTLEQYEVNEMNTITQSGVYMEEVKPGGEGGAAPKRTRRTKEQIEADNK